MKVFIILLFLSLNAYSLDKCTRTKNLLKKAEAKYIQFVEIEGKFLERNPSSKVKDKLYYAANLIKLSTKRERYALIYDYLELEVSKNCKVKKS